MITLAGDRCARAARPAKNYNFCFVSLEFLAAIRFDVLAFVRTMHSVMRLQIDGNRWNSLHSTSPENIRNT